VGERGRKGNEVFFEPFDPFRGKSMELPAHEPFTRRAEFSKSTLIKPDQPIPLP